MIGRTNGKKLPEEHIGILYIKGDNVTSGYYNNPEATKSIITNDAWLNTGDLAFIKNGRVVIIGRQKEVIFVNGSNYYSSDLERTAQEIPEIEMNKVAFCGFPDEKSKNDEIIAFVLFTKRKLEKFIPISNSISHHIKQKTGLTVKHIVPVKKIPITTSGKIQRFALIKEYNQGKYNELIQEISGMSIAIESAEKELELAAPKNTFANPIEQDILNVWNEITENKNKISLHDNFIEVGGDSLLIAKIANRLEKIYPDKITVADFFGYPTVAKLAGYIDSKFNDGIKFKPEYIAIPLMYCIENENRFKRIEFSFNLSSELSENVDVTNNAPNEIKSNNTNANYFISALALSFSKLIKENLIVIYAATKQKSSLSKLKVDITKFEEFNDLVAEVKNALDSETNVFPFEQIHSVGKSNNEAMVLVYDKALISSITDKRKTFDIAIGYSFINNCLSITCEYNTKYKNEAIKSIVKNVFLIIETIINEYSIVQN